MSALICRHGHNVSVLLLTSVGIKLVVESFVGPEEYRPIIKLVGFVFVDPCI